MPKEGEICIYCEHEIRRTVEHIGTLDGVTQPAYGWACGPDCGAATGPSDAEPPPDQ